MPPPIDLDPEELVRMRAAGVPVVLVDCRERWEYDLVHLPNALLVPLGEISRRAEEIPQEGEVVVYCHHGIRSRRAAALLRQAGHEKARSLAGGIDHWSLAIEPSLPRY